MKDVRALVPREPPEGMLAWAEKRFPDLSMEGLLIETAWAPDWSLEPVMDEWSQGKKVRAIFARCSGCSDSGYLWRQRDGYGRYGFVHPDLWTEGGRFDVAVHGDEVTCPFCGDPVVVVQGSKLRKGYFVAASVQVMSAAVVGQERLLVLTGWTVEKRIYRSGRRELAAVPAEAYVFSPTECAQLMGWVNSYSGTAGYFVQYTKGWRQPKDWRARWGVETVIFGLTPELIAGSCLPHCKLDVYMEPRLSRDRYPVAWLRLYQTHPNVESVLTHGLPFVLDDLLEEAVGTGGWTGQNRTGLPELTGLHWEERRPAQILGLTRDELRLARAQGWGARLWRLFTGAKALGERLTQRDILDAYYLGDENVTELVGRGPVGKSLRYLLRQIQLAGVEPEDQDPDPGDVIDVRTLLDYWSMADRAGLALDTEAVRYPRDLLAAHDRVSALAAAQEDRDLAGLFRIRRRLLARYAFQADGLLIRPARSQRELKREGEALSHCVASYGKSHAAGKTAIFFIREKAAPGVPYYTLELDEVNLKVRQNRGKRNCPRTPQIAAFEALWLDWLRAGSPRDKTGAPRVPRRQADGIA